MYVVAPARLRPGLGFLVATSDLGISFALLRIMLLRP